MKTIKIKPARQLLLLGLILPYLIFIGLLSVSKNFQKYDLIEIVLLLLLVFIIPHLIVYFSYLREDFGKRIRFENDRIIFQKAGRTNEIYKSQIDQVTVTTAKWLGTGWQLFDFVTIEMKNGTKYHVTSLISPATKILRLIDLPNRVKFRNKIIPIIN